MRFLLLRIATVSAVAGLLSGLIGVFIDELMTVSAFAWSMSATCLFARIVLEDRKKTQYLRSLKRHATSTNFD